MGKSDPYARVLLSGVTRGRTVTFRNTTPVSSTGFHWRPNLTRPSLAPWRWNHCWPRSIIRNLEAMGKSDPYARVLLSGVTRGRTVTFRNNLNPDATANLQNAGDILLLVVDLIFTALRLTNKVGGIDPLQCGILPVCAGR
jgi:hypothetical protein